MLKARNLGEASDISKSGVNLTLDVFNRAVRLPPIPPNTRIVRALVPLLDDHCFNCVIELLAASLLLVAYASYG